MATPIWKMINRHNPGCRKMATSEGNSWFYRLHEPCQLSLLVIPNEFLDIKLNLQQPFQPIQPVQSLTGIEAIGIKGD